MALNVVCGTNFRCVLHHLSSLTRSNRYWGQLCPKTDPKQQKNKTKMIMFLRVLSASKWCSQKRPAWPRRSLPGPLGATRPARTAMASPHSQPHGTKPYTCIVTRTYIRKLKSRVQSWPIFERFSAKARPGTLTNGSGLKHAA